MVLLLMKIVSCWWPFLFGCYNQWRFQISSHHLPSTLSEIFLKIRPRLSQKNQKSLSENFQKRLGENLSPDCHWSPTMAMSSLGPWHSHGLPCSAGKFSMLGWKIFPNSRLSENSKICKLVQCTVQASKVSMLVTTFPQVKDLVEFLKCAGLSEPVTP